MTISVGVATRGPESTGMDTEGLVDAADAALYRAKDAGCDRVAD